MTKPKVKSLKAATSKEGQAESEATHALVMKSLDDDQAQNVISIPLAGKSTIADYMVIAEGRSTRQVATMAQKLAERVKQAGGEARIEGLANADWVLIDTGDVIVHLFRPEVRSFYNLERMWTVEEEEANAAEEAVSPEEEKLEQTDSEG